MPSPSAYPRGGWVSRTHSLFIGDTMQALLKLSRGIDWINTQVGKYVVWLILALSLIHI